LTPGALGSAGGFTYAWSGSTMMPSSAGGEPADWIRSVSCMDGPAGSNLIAPSPVVLVTVAPPLVPPVTVIFAVRSAFIWLPVAVPSWASEV